MRSINVIEAIISRFFASRYWFS